MRLSSGVLFGSLFFACAVVSPPASAGFQSWSFEVDEDPFSGGDKVVVNYSMSLGSAVIIFCDSLVPGIRIRTVPGFAYDIALEGEEPLMEFAVDGELLLSSKGRTGSVGDNLAIAETDLTDDDAKKFVAAFVASKRQIAIKDGITDQPLLLKARGTTKAGNALQACLDK